MAEIKIQRKKRGGAGLWLLILILLAVIVLLALDATETISSPDWIKNGETEIIDPAEVETSF